MERLIFSIGLSLILLLSNAGVTFAKEEIVEASGSYFIDLRIEETFANATERAREEARRNAVEKAGVYVQSYSVVKDLILDYDEVKTVAAQILKIHDEQIDSKSAGPNLLEIICTIRASVDDNNSEILNTIAQDKNRIEEATRRNKELEHRYNELKAQMEQLRNKYDVATDAEKVELKREVAQNYDNFNALMALSDGNKFYLSKDYTNALSSYSQAIQINPTLFEAYNNRGNIFAELQQYEVALNDFRAAATINNNDAYSHNNLGGVYIVMERYDDAVKECTQAIKLNPNFAEAYHNRAIAYYYQNKYKQALNDAKRAVELNPFDADTKNLYDGISRSMN